jgi:TetR/AcrR family transcriptional repressor of mexJK operon
VRRPTKRNAIRSAAQELFLRSGLHQTSMDAVAAAAGVTKQTLYRYYRSKDELFVDALGGLVAAQVSAGIAGLRPAGPAVRDDLEAALLAIARRVVENVLEPPYLALVRVVVAEAGDFPEVARQFRQALIDRFTAELGGLLASEAFAPLVTVPPGSTAVRLFIGPLLSYLLEALMLEPSEVRRRAEAELPVLVAMVARTLARGDQVP